MAYYVPHAERAPIEYYCARRASASIRTAAQTEQTIEAVRPEQLSLDEVEVAMRHQLPQAAAARLRRDTRIGDPRRRPRWGVRRRMDIRRLVALDMQARACLRRAPAARCACRGGLGALDAWAL